jgi:hypothetical protein
MIRRIWSVTLILLLYLPVCGQNEVIDISRLDYSGNIRFLPDVDGKVVIEKSFYQYLLPGPGRDEIPVFPGWPVTVGGANERGGAFGHLDEDNSLEIIYPAGLALYAFNVDGSTVVGWPQTLDNPTDGSAAWGDIDGDGVGEVVVTTHQNATFAIGSIYAFEGDGSLVPGFPIATEGGAVRTPALADLDLDGALEIIVTVRNWPDGFVFVYRGDGTIYPGWPQRMDYVPGSAVAVGDINGDEIPEIVTESYYRLHAYSADGVLLPGFPYLPGENRVFSYSTPILADLDGDGNREIICGDHSIGDGTGAVHIVRHNGISLPDWPRFTASWVYAPPSVGDIDSDGELDVVAGDQTLSSTAVNKIYAWTAMTGEAIPGFPVEEVFGINSQIILADLDGDGQIELMADDNTSDGKYAGYNHDGTVIEGWPLPVDGSTFYINPFVADINNDGMMAISGGGYNQDEAISNFFLWDPGIEYITELAPLPVLQFNTRRSGVYGDTLMVGLPVYNDKVEKSWTIGPNPASDYIFINFSGQKENYLQGNIDVSIFNSQGELFYIQKIFPGNNRLLINISGFPPGIYLVKVSGKDLYGVVKIIKTSRTSS